MGSSGDEARPGSLDALKPPSGTLASHHVDALRGDVVIQPVATNVIDFSVLVQKHGP